MHMFKILGLDTRVHTGEMYSLGSIFLPNHIFYLVLLSHSIMLQQKFKLVSHIFNRSLLSSLSDYQTTSTAHQCHDAGNSML